MDPQPHPLLHFLVRMKPTSTNVFLQVTKHVEVTRGKIWAVRRMLKCYPATHLKLIPHQIGSKETGVIIAKGLFGSTAFQGILTLWRVAAPSATKKQTTSLCSSLLDERISHYAHLQINKETTVWTCPFSQCLSPTPDGSIVI